MDKIKKDKSEELFRILSKFFTEKFIPETKKPTVRLMATRGKTKAQETKFGGKPYIPKGFSYPFIDDEPMVLICQLNFAEMPYLDGYPKSGLLQVYLKYEETAMFEPECYKIFYHTDLSGKNCYKNPFKQNSKSCHLDEIRFYPESSSGMFDFSVKTLRTQIYRAMLSGSDVEMSDEAIIEVVAPKTDKAECIKTYREFSDYLREQRDAIDPKKVDEFIDRLFPELCEDYSCEFSEDILSLNPDREYKVKFALFDMNITQDTKEFNELFIEKFNEYVRENSFSNFSETDREIAEEFIKNTSSSDVISLLYDIFSEEKYNELMSDFFATSLPKYDKYGACLVGGYPRFEQGDYREDEYSELLLQIDSFDYSDGYENTVMWGDGGVINLFIKPENLKNADFSDIEICGDCG